MSRSASVTLSWGDGEYVFRLGIAELEKLQEQTDCGPAMLAKRLADGSWRVKDVRETIRFGLIGGGMAVNDAMRKVRLFVDDVPLLQNVIPAQAIVMAALVGSEDEPTGAQDAPKADAATTTSLMEKSDSPPSTTTEL
jgi:hypothetical protein